MTPDKWDTGEELKVLTDGKMVVLFYFIFLLFSNNAALCLTDRLSATAAVHKLFAFLFRVLHSTHILRSNAQFAESITR
jgi:hypothetical protein